MPKPTTVAEVQSFLGMVNHYGKFIFYLHQMKRPLEDLIRKNRPCAWNKTHNSAIEQIKKTLLSLLLLEHYDPTKTLVVGADASTTGIGTVLLQRDSRGHERAVYHMAQSLPHRRPAKLFATGKRGSRARLRRRMVPQVRMGKKVHITDGP